MYLNLEPEVEYRGLCRVFFCVCVCVCGFFCLFVLFCFVFDKPESISNTNAFHWRMVPRIGSKQFILLAVHTVGHLYLWGINRKYWMYLKFLLLSSWLPQVVMWKNGPVVLLSSLEESFFWKKGKVLLMYMKAPALLELWHREDSNAFKGKEPGKEAVCLS